MFIFILKLSIFCSEGVNLKYVKGYIRVNGHLCKQTICVLLRHPELNYICTSLQIL